MTSSNINKIMRSNITLKPWILSKNTSEIVNTCIQKIYKQSQNNFKNDRNKVASSKPENKAPIRSLKSQERVRIPLSINISRAKKGAIPATNTRGNVGTGGGANVTPATAAAAMAATGERLASNAAANNRRGTLANGSTHRKLLKSSPNYKIYSSRRFGSSASSSNASIFRRNDERRRSNTQTTQLNYLLRTFATQMNQRQPLTSILPKFMVSARNQHMETRTTSQLPTHMAQMATAIQRDLMPISSALKDRIALGRPRLSKMAAAQKAKSVDPMSGWHHPPAQDAFLTRVNQRGIASVELQEQYKRMKNANRARQFEHITQLETRNAILGGLGKNLAQPRVVDGFDLDATTVGSARDSVAHQTARTQAPHFEHTLKTLLSRQHSNEIDAHVPPTLPSVNISHITAAAAPAPPKQPTKSVPEHRGAFYNITQQIKRPSDERVEVAMQSASASASAPNNSNLPALQPTEAEASEAHEAPPPPQMLTMSKKSATSQIVSRVAAAAAGAPASSHTMRYNHSAHMKKF